MAQIIVTVYTLYGMHKECLENHIYKILEAGITMKRLLVAFLIFWLVLAAFFSNVNAQSNDASRYEIPISIKTTTDVITATLTLEFSGNALNIIDVSTSEGVSLTTTNLNYIGSVYEVAVFPDEKNAPPKDLELIKEQAIDLDFESMLRKYRTYKGKIVHFSATVWRPESIRDGVGDRLILSQDPKDEQKYGIFVNYNGDMLFLEKDNLEVWALLTGIEKDSYGSHPELDALHMELIDNDLRIPARCADSAAAAKVAKSTAEVVSSAIELKAADIARYAKECQGAIVKLSGTVDSSNPETGNFVVDAYDYGWTVHSDEALVLYSGEDSFVDGDKVVVFAQVTGDLETIEYLVGGYAIFPVVRAIEVNFSE